VSGVIAIRIQHEAFFVGTARNCGNCNPAHGNLQFIESLQGTGDHLEIEKIFVSYSLHNRNNMAEQSVAAKRI
jgi:hypothetical protein